MDERKQEKNEKYQRARSDFDELDTEEKVVFILEATVSTVARGIDELGRVISDEINNAFSRRAERKARRGTYSNGEPAAPPAEGGPATGDEGSGGHDDMGDEKI